jgi:hypothetical protein
MLGKIAARSSKVWETDTNEPFHMSCRPGLRPGAFHASCIHHETPTRRVGLQQRNSQGIRSQSRRHIHAPVNARSASRRFPRAANFSNDWKRRRKKFQGLPADGGFGKIDCRSLRLAGGGTCAHGLNNKEVPIPIDQDATHVQVLLKSLNSKQSLPLAFVIL